MDVSQVPSALKANLELLLVCRTRSASSVRSLNTSFILPEDALQCSCSTAPEIYDYEAYTLN